MTTNWQTRIADWSKLDDNKAIKAVRQQVFITEQHVPIELEWDSLDTVCLHLLVSGPPANNVATARMHTANNVTHIGRMAVLKPYRLQGIAAMMLTTLLEQARLNNVKEIELNAQTTAIGFYQRYGFVITGDEFADAGIPHYKMLCQLL